MDRPLDVFQGFLEPCPRTTEVQSNKSFLFVAERLSVTEENVGLPEKEITVPPGEFLRQGGHHYIPTPRIDRSLQSV